MKDFLKNIIVVIVGIAILAGVWLVWQNTRGVKRAANNSQNNSTSPTDNLALNGENATDFPLKLPENFKIEVFAKNLPGARVTAFDQFGNMWVSRTSAGVVTVLEIKDGKVNSQNDVLRNLRKPHGLAFDSSGNGMLYFAEEDKVTRIATYSDDDGQKIADLPTQGGGHFTRTLGF